MRKGKSVFRRRMESFQIQKKFESNAKIVKIVYPKEVNKIEHFEDSFVNAIWPGQLQCHSFYFIK